MTNTIEYPQNPSIGDEFTVGGTRKRWDGTKWKNVSFGNHERRLQELETFEDYMTLKIFQSPTDGGLTEIQTRTVNANEVYEVRKTSDNSLATIYSDAAGTTEIVQNGTDNKSGGDGVVEFFVDDGDYYIVSHGEANNFSVDVLRQDLANPAMGALLVRGAVVYINTIADLKALDTSELVDGQNFHTNGYLADGDGGASRYIYRSTSSQEVDDVTVIGAGGQGQYLISTDGPIKAEQAGLFSGLEVDQRDALIRFLRVAALGYDIEFAADGQYMSSVDTTIIPSMSGVTIDGRCSTITVPQEVGSDRTQTASIIRIDSPFKVEIKNLNLVGNHNFNNEELSADTNNYYQGGIRLDNPNGCTVRGVNTIGFLRAIDLFGNSGTISENNKVTSCTGRDGFIFVTARACQNTVIEDCHAYDMRLTGITRHDGSRTHGYSYILDTECHDSSIIRSTSTNCGADCFRTNQICRNVVADGCVSYNNRRYAFRWNGSSVTMRDCKVIDLNDPDFWVQENGTGGTREASVGTFRYAIVLSGESLEGFTLEGGVFRTKASSYGYGYGLYNDGSVGSMLLCSDDYRADEFRVSDAKFSGLVRDGVITQLNGSSIERFYASNSEFEAVDGWSITGIRSGFGAQSKVVVVSDCTFLKGEYQCMVRAERATVSNCIFIQPGLRAIQSLSGDLLISESTIYDSGNPLENDGSTPLLKIGGTFIVRGVTYKCDIKVIVSSLTYEDGTGMITASTVEPHGLQTGYRTYIRGAEENEFNASRVEVTVIDGNTFTYTPTTAPTVYEASGDITCNDNINNLFRVESARYGYRNIYMVDTGGGILSQSGAELISPIS